MSLPSSPFPNPQSHPPFNPSQDTTTAVVDSSPLFPVPPEGRVDLLRRPDPRHPPNRDPGPTLDTPLKLDTHALTSYASQPSLLSSLPILSDQLAKNLRDAGRSDLASVLESCDTHWIRRSCCRCDHATLFRNRCNTWYCPTCQPRLARQRRLDLEWWTHHIPRPLHVVLTVRNANAITPQYVRGIVNAFRKLRHRKIAHNWRGGLWSLETTNEGRGWHVHIHSLIDSPFTPADELSRQWADLVGQDFAIVAVKRVVGESYLREVTKYAVKGTQIASWSGEDAAALIDALGDTRTFGVFGTLYGKREEWTRHTKHLDDSDPCPQCGCTNWHCERLDAWEARTGRILTPAELAAMTTTAPLPRSQPELNFDAPAPPDTS